MVRFDSPCALACLAIAMTQVACGARQVPASVLTPPSSHSVDLHPQRGAIPPRPRPRVSNARDAGAALWLGLSSGGPGQVHFAGMLELTLGDGRNVDDETDRILHSCKSQDLGLCEPEQLQQVNKLWLAGRRQSRTLRFASDLPYKLEHTPASCVVEAVEEIEGSFKCTGDDDRRLTVHRKADGLIVRPLGSGWGNLPETAAVYTLYPSVAADVIAEEYAEASSDTDLGSGGGRMLSLERQQADALLGRVSDAIAAAGFDLNTASIDDVHKIATKIHLTLLLRCHLADFGDLRATSRCSEQAMRTMIGEIASAELDASLRLRLCGSTVPMDAEHAVCDTLVKESDGRPMPAARLLFVLRHMRKLKGLSLRGLQEPPPSAGLDSLEPLKWVPQLERLEASASGISDLTPLRALANLHTLDLSMNPVRDLTPLLHLARLRTLILAHTEIATLAHIEGMTSLEVLDISATTISDLSPLSSVRGLKSLRINGSAAFDVPRERLAQIVQTNRVSRELDDTAKLIQAHQLPISLKPLAQCASLTDVQIGAARLTHLEGLAALPNLRVLTLSSVSLAEASWLAELTELESLDLSNNPLKRIDAIKHLVKLRTLALSGMRIADLAPLTSLQKLERLDLSKSHKVDLASVSKMSQLRTLILADVQEVDLTPVGAMASLQELDLQFGKFTNLSAVCGAQNLRKLNLHRAVAVDADIEQLRGCTQLKTLIIDEALSAAARDLQTHLPNLEISGL